MNPGIQIKFLRVLETGELERVGGQETIRIDVRVIAATHQDLTSRRASGAFRDDFFYRLAGFEIHLPPLCERHGDIPLLVDRYLARLCREADRPIPSISAEAMFLLESYQWPGNVRELQHVLRQAVAHMHGGVLLPEDLPDKVRRPEAQELAQAEIRAQVRALFAGRETGVLAAVQAAYEPVALEIALQLCKGNHHQAARLLGIARNTLASKLRHYGMAGHTGHDAPMP